jgi:hypothetical protein
MLGNADLGNSGKRKEVIGSTSPNVEIVERKI